MKKIYLATVVALMGAAFVGVPAFAAFTCEVGFTGPDSQNMCESVEKYQCSVENTNSVIITNSTEQVVYSGDVTVEGNGDGGNASSGSATNDAGTTFVVVITNGDPETESPATCFATVSIPATEIPETPEEPGKGENEAPVIPRVLPTASGSQAPKMLAILGTGAAIVGIGAAYRRLHL